VTNPIRVKCRRGHNIASSRHFECRIDRSITGVSWSEQWITVVWSTEPKTLVIHFDHLTLMRK
jgi:hypothetical protein